MVQEGPRVGRSKAYALRGGSIDSLSIPLCCRSRGLLACAQWVADLPDGCYGQLVNLSLRRTRSSVQKGTRNERRDDDLCLIGWSCPRLPLDRPCCCGRTGPQPLLEAGSTARLLLQL